MYLRGVGEKPDRAIAATLLKQSCDAGDGSGCYEYATLVVDKDPSAAVRAVKKGVAAGDDECLSLLGVFTQKGVGGITPDLAAAAELVRKSCGDGDLEPKDRSRNPRGSAVGCRHLGTVYFYGDGVPKDTARGIRLYKWACDHGDGGGCNQLGLAYGKEGVPPNPKVSREAFEQACKLGDAGGCGNYGQVKEGAHDLPGAVALYRKACAAGDDWSCQQLERLHQTP
jgi:TPR repeat protein